MVRSPSPEVHRQVKAGEWWEGDSSTNVVVNALVHCGDRRKAGAKPGASNVCAPGGGGAEAAAGRV